VSTAKRQEAYRPGRRELANAIRVLSMDAVERAKSGHPGAPMGMADIAEVLWNDFLRHNPGNPAWVDRDRFVLSNGHGSMLLYSLLHLTGYPLSLDDLKAFRRLGSKTPGHPEHGDTPGVETTTGPLGQGLANAVGMAIAERALASRFNRDGLEIVDHYTYVTVGDGCLMEGISHEACSLAGTLGLGKLIAIYDANGISIDGRIEGWYTEDVAARFAAYDWHVVPPIDGHDAAAIRAAIESARAATDRPSLVICKTVIGWPAPHKGGTEKAHGAPLGPDEVGRSRELLGWPYPAFVVPEAIYAAWDASERGRRHENEWNERYARYRSVYPGLAAEFERRSRHELPPDWRERAAAYVRNACGEDGRMATREASRRALNAYGPLLPELLGGSADLTESNCTDWAGSKALSSAQPDGNYVNYGVREFAMSAIMNGLALHGGFIPYGGTFLVFSDYARNAVRLAALMRIQVIFVYTHDSIGLGEDGPTHQPIEHAASLRLIPHLSVWRPCDLGETAVAWKAALERRDGPTALLLTRQKQTPNARSEAQIGDIARGAYVLFEGGDRPEAILLATGSEVELAMGAARALAAEGRPVRVVSMPSVDAFERQDRAYRDAVLPPEVRKRAAIEAGVGDCWYKFVGLDGKVIGLSDFGRSGTGEAVFEHFGFTEDHIVRTLRAWLEE
jgi:transketolase